VDYSSKAPYVILYEDEDCLYVYKKRDVFSIRTNDKLTYTHNLYHYLYLYLSKKGERPFIIHRLDYETSGVMVFAKSQIVKERLQSLFEEHKVERDYEAVIKEKIPLGKSFDVTNYIKKDGKHTSLVKENEGGDVAITHIKSSNYINIGTAMRVNIETGRHNQIRLAFSSLGLTLLGDKRFNGDVSKRLYLNAYKLAFPKESLLAKQEVEVDPLWVK
jgi:23S rRNA pseudouridine1911/1915/1917 synthase